MVEGAGYGQAASAIGRLTHIAEGGSGDELDLLAELCAQLEQHFAEELSQEFVQYVFI